MSTKQYTAEQAHEIIQEHWKRLIRIPRKNLILNQKFFDELWIIEKQLDALNIGDVIIVDQD